MRQRDRGLADRAVQLHRPFGDLGGEATRQFVGLVQVDVEQRDADAQRADHLDEFVVDAARLSLRFLLGRDGGGTDVVRRGSQRRQLQQPAIDVDRQVEVDGVQRHVGHGLAGEIFERQRLGRP